MKKTLNVSTDDLEWLYVPDIEYYKYSDNIIRKMQLILPYRRNWEGKQTKYPLLLFIPGSAWYKQEMYNSIPAYSKLAERGFVTAIIQYRESNISKFPAQIEDVENAIMFLLSKANDFHIDTENIFISGNSSGGHIALLTALRSANGILDTANFDSKIIKGVIAESAPSDMVMCSRESILEHMSPEFRPVKDLLGIDEVRDDLQIVEEASCKNYISHSVNIPPILLIHGNVDEQVNISQSQHLYDLLCKVNAEVDFYELEHINHGGSAFWNDNILDIITDFAFKYTSKA